MNVHSPERQEGETREQYKLRRQLSKQAVRAMTLAGIGVQRKLPSSREQLRDGQRMNGRGPKGTYGAGLLEPQRARNLKRMEDIHQSDANGAITLVGRAPVTGERRLWLAGISSQRGY